MDGARVGRLAGKVALITGAASAFAGRRRPCSMPRARRSLPRPQRSGPEGAWAGRGSRVPPRRDRRSALARSGRRGRRRIRRPRHPGQQRRHWPLGNIEKATLADWRKVNAVNVEGTFLGCREAVRAMKETGGGSIVNLSSVARHHRRRPRPLAYCASKGAVRLMTKSAALSCARHGFKIRVNSVHPSFAETPMVLEGIARAKDPERVRARASSAPRRWGGWARRRKSRAPSFSLRATSPRSPPARSSWWTGA